MIRLKNNVLPVWFQWDGDETSLERAKQSIIEDIRQHGFDHFTAFADIADEPTEEDKGWDGEIPEETVTLKPNTKAKSNKSTHPSERKQKTLADLAKQQPTDTTS